MSDIPTEEQYPEMYDSEQPQTIFTIEQHLGSIAIEGDSVLADHQRDAFEDIVNFYRNGGREGYAQLPTGTGKTVLFVEICKRLIESGSENGVRRRAIVLVPTIDLVAQTIGSIDKKTDKRRGFAGFAPDLDVRPLDSKRNEKQRRANIVEADVLVTTYNSFRNLVDALKNADEKTMEEWESEKQQLEEKYHTTQREVVELKQLSQIRSREIQVSEDLSYAKRKINTLIFRNEGKEEPDSEIRSKLAALIGILEPEDENTPDEARLRSLRAVLLDMLSSEPNVQESIRRQQLLNKRLSLQKKINKAEKNKEEVPDKYRKSLTEVNKQEAEYANQPLELSDFEVFLKKLLVRTRPDRKFILYDIRNDADRRELVGYEEAIRDKQSAVKFTQGRLKSVQQSIFFKGAVDSFDLIVCDEAHRSIGTQTWEAIRNYAQLKDIALLGLTATDEYYDRGLEDYFEGKVHELTKQEAIDRSIVNPVALFVHETGLRFGNVSLDARGEYDRLTLREMRFSTERNDIGVQYARLLSEHGYHGLVTAIPGNEGDHAKEMARLINQQEMIDPHTGKTRLMRAHYILNSTENRDEYYKALESGELDWLTFIDVIREGYDSDRAKAMINMRPTRSPLLAEQRLGRIGRASAAVPVSVVIDLFDGIEREENHTEIPPVLAADVFELDNIDQGHIVGDKKHADAAVVTALKEKLSGSITAHHTRYARAIENMPLIDASGIMQDGKELKATSQWQTIEAIKTSYRGYLPSDLVIEAATAEDPTVRTMQGRRGARIMTLFNVYDVMNLYSEKPEINPWKLYIGPDSQRWITAEGCTTLLSKRFPTISPEEILDAIKAYELETQQHFKRDVARVPLFSEKKSTENRGFAYMFRLEEITERLVPYLVRLRQQLLHTNDSSHPD